MLNKMERKEIIEVLKKHNDWRRGADVPMLSPTLIGDAIDAAVLLLKEDGKLLEEVAISADTFSENEWTNVED